MGLNHNSPWEEEYMHMYKEKEDYEYAQEEI